MNTRPMLNWFETHKTQRPEWTPLQYINSCFHFHPKMQYNKWVFLA